MLNKNEALYCMFYPYIRNQIDWLSNCGWKWLLNKFLTYMNILIFLMHAVRFHGRVQIYRFCTCISQVCKVIKCPVHFLLRIPVVWDEIYPNHLLSHFDNNSRAVKFLQNEISSVDSKIWKQALTIRKRRNQFMDFHCSVHVHVQWKSIFQSNECNVSIMS